jgi:hypothetical protein
MTNKLSIWLAFLAIAWLMYGSLTEAQKIS